jgi:hypothetical protein
VTSGPNTLLVNGTDIRTLTGITVVGFMELYAPGTRRGSDDVIPGRQGQLGAQLPYDAYSFSVPIQVAGATREAMIANLMAVGVLLGGNGLVTLTRKIANLSGGQDTHTASGRVDTSFAVALLNPSLARTVLQFINLSGAWTPDSGVTWLVP